MNHALNQMAKYALLLLFLFGIMLLIPSSIEAASNQNLRVSAENKDFANYFAGSQVIEVQVLNPLISATDQGKGEPDVSVNGQDLRMVQGSDGAWYAYFANKEKATIADSISFAGGAGQGGVGLDFGIFCSSKTSSSVLGTSFSDTKGVALPRSGGISGGTNGSSSFKECTGVPTTSPTLNNVLRNVKKINTNPSIAPGQIGLNPNLWPIIQLFSFDQDVIIQYNKAGGAQKVVLHYDEIPNITLQLDRNQYPSGSQVFVTVKDMQLNQDPTDQDSWTFNIDSPIATFYQAFDEDGDNSANGGPGLIDLVPHLSSLGFEKNGKLSLDLDSVAELKTNKNQPSSSINNGMGKTYSQIITLLETGRNTGIFKSVDSNNESTIGILNNAPRGRVATIEYNDDSYSILTGSFTASVSLKVSGSEFRSGTRTTITLVDNDQNINANKRDKLDVFRESAIIPAFQVGSPITLEQASSVRFYPTISSNLASGGTVAQSSVPDSNSDRLIIDSGPATFGSNFTFEMISIDLGKSANELRSLFIDKSQPNVDGTNWLNYDLRSFQNQLDLKDFSKTTMSFYFGLSDSTPITFVDSGDITSAQGLIKIDDADIQALGAKTGNAFLVINFNSGSSGIFGTISNEVNKQPIVIDFFSFGLANNQEKNNAIYRLELKETEPNSGTFSGTLEYAMVNQLNIFDPNLIKSLRPISDDVKFVVSNRLIDAKGINIAYSDIAKVGSTISTSTKTDIKTNSGSVGLGSPSYRFGQEVLVILEDPDLNERADLIESYLTINDPLSPNVDTVGNSNGETLLEVQIKDFRYKRCTINGIETGGLASTGFTLVETGPNSGVFHGNFKLPSKICDQTGTKLISTAGGKIKLVYHDFRDDFGKENIISSSGVKASPEKISLSLNSHEFTIPTNNQSVEVLMEGKLANYLKGDPIKVHLILPNKFSEDFEIQGTSDGRYKGVLTLNSNSIPGVYQISINHRDSISENLSFVVKKQPVPLWIKNNAAWWGADIISKKEFLQGIEYLISQNIISIQKPNISEIKEDKFPDWIKTTARWWSEGSVSDDEFVLAMEFMARKGIIRV